MKKTILMFAAAGLMLATPSCKKGENDPFLSLASRKARVAGDWNATGYEFTSRNDEADGDYQTNSSSLSGNTMTSTYVDFDAGTATSVTTTTTTTLDKATYVFGKEGTWTREWNTTAVSVSTVDIGGGVMETTTNTTVSTSTTTGDWSFMGKVKDAYKNKERITMNMLTSASSNQTTTVISYSDATPTFTAIGDLWTNTASYSSGEVIMTYEIDQLKGKEMILKRTESDSGSWSNTPNGGSTTTTNSDIYTSEETTTLTAQ